MPDKRPAYRNGDQHSGGGGPAGGGGKKRRPPTGWEKGEVGRDVDLEHSTQKVPVKPGRGSTRKAIEEQVRQRGSSEKTEQS